MSDPAVEIERRDGVVICHLDDGKANALTTSIISTLIDAVRAAEADDSVAAVVIHGREGKLSGGFDLSVMMGGDLAAPINLVADGGELVRTFYGSGVPVVAACTGHAVAAGALMLLGCDIRVGADIDCKIVTGRPVEVAAALDASLEEDPALFTYWQTHENYWI